MVFLSTMMLPIPPLHTSRYIICSSRFILRLVKCNLTKTSLCNNTVGFIGLGNMGGHMAVSLSKSGFTVHVFDKLVDRVKHVKKSVGEQFSANIVEHSSLRNLMTSASPSTVITMLPASPHVLEVYCSGANGLTALAKPDTLFIDCTTGDPEVAKQVSILANDKQCCFIDAPVSGGVLAAENAGLTFMVGGAQKDVSRAFPMLLKMGKQVFHCGPVGSGLAAKICNNMLLAISMIGTSEAMALGAQMGLEPEVLAKIINCSSGRCWSSEVYNPVPGIIPNVPSSNNYAGGFGTALMAKDLGLAQTASTSTGQPIPLGSIAHQIYRMLCSHGYSEKDFSSVYKFLLKS